MRKILVALLLIAVIASAQTASAYYIPAGHMAEAKQAAKQGVVGWYDFGLKYSDQQFGYEILRNLAQMETNSGRIEELHLVIQKYKK